MMTLYFIYQYDFYSANSLKQQSADRHVTPLGYIILIPRQPVLLLLLYAVCLAGAGTHVLLLACLPGAGTHDQLLACLPEAGTHDLLLACLPSMWFS